MLDPVFVKLIVVLTRLDNCQSKQTSYDTDDPNVNSVNHMWCDAYSGMFNPICCIPVICFSVFEPEVRHALI